MLRTVLLLAGFLLWASGARAQDLRNLSPTQGIPPVVFTQLQLARLHITHIVIVTQENRSFDQYFGTYPGADGTVFAKCSACSISGTTLTLNGTISGSWAIGQGITGPGVDPSTQITALLTGSLGVAGSTYSLAGISQTVAAEAMTGGPCEPNSLFSAHGCTAPWHIQNQLGKGNGHHYTDFAQDIDDGGSGTLVGTLWSMDGFVYNQLKTNNGCSPDPYASSCVTTGPGGSAWGPASQGGKDTMSWRDSGEIPNYWTYAQDFTLAQKFFESVGNWSNPQHHQLTSGWYGLCTHAANLTGAISGTALTTSGVSGTLATGETLFGAGVATNTMITAGSGSAWTVNNSQTVASENMAAGDASTCKESVSDLGGEEVAWATLPYLMDKNSVTWKSYLAIGAEPDCSPAQQTCNTAVQNATTVPSIWNVLPYFTLSQGQTSAYVAAHVQPLNQLFVDINAGNLPSVVWATPSQNVSEHPQAKPKDGENYVATIVNAISQSQYAQNTVILLNWDDWGGYYDHVLPPTSQKFNQNLGTVTDIYGWGIRVPLIVIDAYAKPSFIDNQYMSHDNFLKFIEDIFLNSARMDPATDGFPDPRPFVAEAITTVTDPGTGTTHTVGDLLNDFDFSQAPTALPVLPQQ